MRCVSLIIVLPPWKQRGLWQKIWGRKRKSIERIVTCVICFTVQGLLTPIVGIFLGQSSLRHQSKWNFSLSATTTASRLRIHSEMKFFSNSLCCMFMRTSGSLRFQFDILVVKSRNVFSDRKQQQETAFLSLRRFVWLSKYFMPFCGTFQILVTLELFHKMHQKITTAKCPLSWFLWKRWTVSGTLVTVWIFILYPEQNKQRDNRQRIFVRSSRIWVRTQPAAQYTPLLHPVCACGEGVKHLISELHNFHSWEFVGCIIFWSCLFLWLVIFQILFYCSCLKGFHVLAWLGIFQLSGKNENVLLGHILPVASFWTSALYFSCRRKQLDRRFWRNCLTLFTVFTINETYFDMVWSPQIYIAPGDTRDVFHEGCLSTMLHQVQFRHKFTFKLDTPCNVTLILLCLWGSTTKDHLKARCRCGLSAAERTRTQCMGSEDPKKERRSNF